MTQDLATIIRARPEHAGALTEIAFAAKRHWGYPERWMKNWRDVLTVTSEFIASHKTYAATIAGHMVGFYALQLADGTLHLQHLWVLPDAMGRGIGRALFRHALERARALGFQQLEVESDPNAEGFYERMGARRVGTVVREGERQRRELPILICDTNHTNP
jgi:GNAT superfamily N-acetyltransferase